MKKFLAAVALSAAAASAVAAGGASVPMDRFPAERLRDPAALQNGARLFANYCLGCHSASLMRWQRLRDIGLDERQIKDFLIFGNQKVGDTMTIAMTARDAKLWFGKQPPDLSVIARARTSFEYSGPDYLYTLLRGYYRDAASPTGWNNVVYPNIAMPHILWERQGAREVTIERVAYTEQGAVRTVTIYDAQGRAKVTTTPLAGQPAERVRVSFKPADADQARRFDSEVADLVAFLVYMTDPSAQTRVRIGVWVMLFLFLFAALAWWLNRAYWKDVK
ncbi:MAG: cytochrome c1 [Sutterellaceae bacterium]|nr:cytochrome c1 [Burkholderiaceae bacterium]MCX7901572.1 cytochrome c1 [Burkholderiaceae bacterium]MDW8430580.1 cytochrome c1 [Sutterellaceae bacterium]